jgi:hypothetical protein
MSWFTGILTAISETAGAAKLAMGRLCGSQTRDQASCQEAAEAALKSKRDAYRRAYNAKTPEEYQSALADINYFDARLRELLNTASAKWG